MSRGNFTACPGRWEPSGRLLFPAPADWGTRTAAGGFALTGGRYSLEIKRRVALCGARESAAPAAGDDAVPTAVGKRMDTKVSTPLVNLPVSS